MLTGRDVDAAEAARIGLVSQVTAGDELLAVCYDIAARITGWSQVGVELAKRLLWSGLDAASLETHMRHEGIAQLYVRNLTGNFEEMIQARKDHRSPVYLDDTRQKDT
jgi:enoyl-CoA hydratase